MHKITVSIGNIDNAIKQIENYEKKVKQNVEELLEKLLENGVQIAKNKIIVIPPLPALESGELLRSLNKYIYIKGKMGIIFTDSEHACFVEFGTGVKGANSSHPTLSGGYDSNGHGTDGWYYYDENQGRIRYTQGMPSRPFMYETARELERKVVEIAREVFSQ